MDVPPFVVTLYFAGSKTPKRPIFYKKEENHSVDETPWFIL
jgi:hypothetical protein